MNLQEYLELEKQTTEGPWQAFYEGSGDFALYQISNGNQDVARIWATQDEEIVTVSGPDSCMFGGQQSDKNAQFIAASRTLGPAMAQALIEAEKILSEAYEWAKTQQNALGDPEWMTKVYNYFEYKRMNDEFTG